MKNKHSTQTIKEIWYSLDRINDDTSSIKRYDRNGMIIAKASLNQKSSAFGWKIVKINPKNKSNDSKNLTAESLNKMHK